MTSRNLVKPLASIDNELAERLEKDEAFRRRYIRFWTQTEVASELKRLRKSRNKRQTELAKLTGTGQSAISRIEKADYDGWTYKTLIGIAEVLHARLRIRFEPIEDVISNYRSSGHTEHVSVSTDAGSTDTTAGVTSGAGTFNAVTMAASSSASGWKM